MIALWQLSVCRENIEQMSRYSTQKGSSGNTATALAARAQAEAWLDWAVGEATAEGALHPLAIRDASGRDRRITVTSEPPRDGSTPFAG